MIVRAIAAVSLAATSFAQSYSTNGDAQLKFYVDQALGSNPAIKESFARYRAAIQRLPQVRSLPDPMLEFKKLFGNEVMLATMETTMFSVSQTFPWFGKLSLSEQIAAKEAVAAQEQYEARKAEVVRQVKSAYYDLAYVGRAIAITEENRGLLEQYEKLAEVRYTQGLSPQQGVIKLQTEITDIVNQLEALSSQRVDAEATLNALLNRAPASPAGKITIPSRPKIVIEPAQLQQIAVAHRPELLAAMLQIEGNEKRIDLARKQYWPDVTVGAGFGTMGEQPPSMANISTKVYTLSAGINLPVHRRKYGAAVAEATEDRLGSVEGYRDLRNSVNASVRSIGFRLQTLERQISLFETTLLPQSELALQSTIASYSTGILTVLDVLDSERVLLDVRLGLVRLVSDYMKSLADMERAIGSPFPEGKP